MTTFRERETWLRSLPVPQQQELALALASVVEPAAELSAVGQPPGGLPQVAEAIRIAQTLVEVDRARHRLFSVPEMRSDDEPEGLAWFAYRATCAWIYAADSKSTSPGDGLVNTFSCISDLLDGLAGASGGDDLLPLLIAALHDEASFPELRAQVRNGVAAVLDQGPSTE